MKASIIVNPYSGGGRTARMWREIRDEVRTRLGGLIEFATTAPKDATRFAAEVAHSDSELLVIAGGDGTVNEVINGLFDDDGKPLNSDLKLGILSAGRGCDFIRSLGVPNDYRDAVDLLINPTFKQIDVGCAFFKDEFGREQKRYFMNIACAGLAGLVAKKVNHTPRFIPPEIAYFGGVASAFLAAKGQNMQVTVDKSVVFEGALLNVFVANGKYSGAGMCWAPMAQVDDGRFEVLVVEPIPKNRIVLSAHRLYDGTFINMKGVHHFQGASVVIKTLDDVCLEIDGEQPGMAPMACSILPKALTFAVGIN